MLFALLILQSSLSWGSEDDYLTLPYEIINCESCSNLSSFSVAAKNAPIPEGGHIYDIRTIVVINMNTSVFSTYIVEYDREINQTTVEATQNPAEIQQAINAYNSFKNQTKSALAWNYVPAWHAMGAGYSLSSTAISPDAVFSAVTGNTPFFVTPDITDSMNTIINNEPQQLLLHKRIYETVVVPRLYLYAKTAALKFLFKIKPVNLVLNFPDGSKVEYDVHSPFITVPGDFVWDTAVDSNGNPVVKAYEQRGTASSSYGAGLYNRRPGTLIHYRCAIQYTGTIGVRMISQGRTCSISYIIDGDR